MLSESARAASTAEARFRIKDGNSRPRAIKVIALDRPSEAIVKRLAQLPWANATFLTAFTSALRTGECFSMQGWLGDLAGHTKDLIGEIDSADLVVMVATDSVTTPANGPKPNNWHSCGPIPNSSACRRGPAP